MSKRFIYSILYVWPRSFIEIVDAVVSFATFGLYHFNLYWKFGQVEHCMWATRMANKYGK
jgi:hypothetical protein